MHQQRERENHAHAPAQHEAREGDVVLRRACVWAIAWGGRVVCARGCAECLVLARLGVKHMHMLCEFSAQQHVGLAADGCQLGTAASCTLPAPQLQSAGTTKGPTPHNLTWLRRSEQARALCASAGGTRARCPRWRSRPWCCCLRRPNSPRGRSKRSPILTPQPQAQPSTQIQLPQERQQPWRERRRPLGAGVFELEYSCGAQRRVW